MLRVRMFGTGRAKYADRPIVGFPSQQPHLLFCFLLLNHHESHHRENLAALFWGDRPTQTSRKNLRNALWRLRSAFSEVGARADGYLTVDEEIVSFNPTEEYWCDVLAFEETFRALDEVPGYELSAEQALELEQALDWYTGDLLQGVFDEWCLVDRERLSLHYLETLAKLMTFNGRDGRYERALAYGARILSLDNTREKVHREMMKLHWLAGDRASALAQYKRCVQILRETFGVSPMEETARMYRHILHTPGKSPRGDRPPLTTLEVHLQGPTHPGEALLRHVQRIQGLLEEAGVELSRVERSLDLRPGRSPRQ